MNNFDTMTEAIQAAADAGFFESFKLEKERIRSIESGKGYAPADVKIVNHHRFEGQTSEDDMSIVYLIECSDGAKGAIVDAYGTYANSDLAQFLSGVRMDET